MNPPIKQLIKVTIAMAYHPKLEFSKTKEAVSRVFRCVFVEDYSSLLLKD